MGNNCCCNKGENMRPDSTSSANSKKLKISPVSEKAEKGELIGKYRVNTTGAEASADANFYWMLFIEQAYEEFKEDFDKADKAT